MDTKTNNDVVADLARKAAGQPQIITSNSGREFLVTPDGFQHADVSEPHGVAEPEPAFIRQDVTLQTTDSLVDYLGRFSDADSLMFADIEASRIVAAVDYHGKADPARVAHRATLSLPFSEEWKIWTRIDDRLMPQLEFARFLEENGADVEAPSGAELLEACRDLQAKRKVDFKKAVRTNTDNESFEYSDETTATTKGGSVEVPSKFQLRLPVYFGDTTVELFAFLRWKLEDGQLLLGVKLHRREHVRQAVFKRIVEDAAGRSGVDVVFGRL